MIRQGDRAGRSAARQVRPPSIGAALDGTEHSSANNKRAHVHTVVLDGALEVVHAPDLLDGAEHTVRHLLIVHPHHPQPHRPEQWLDDHIAQRSERRGCLLRGVAHDGLRCGDPALLEDRGGPELVHRALDRTWRVQHPDPTILQPMQRVDPEDDLFQ